MAVGVGPADGDVATVPDALGVAADSHASTASVAARRQKEQLFNGIIIKCVVQLELIQTVEWIVLSSTRPESDATPRRTLAHLRPGDQPISGTFSAREAESDNVDLGWVRCDVDVGERA